MVENICQVQWSLLWPSWFPALLHLDTHPASEHRSVYLSDVVPRLVSSVMAEALCHSSKDLLGPSPVSVVSIEQIRLALDRICGWQCILHMVYLLSQEPLAPALELPLLHSGTETT